MRIDDIKISDEIYNEIRYTSIRLWGTHDDTHGYATKKIDSIKDLPNSASNVVLIIRKFDHWYQKAIAGRISTEAKRTVSTCIKAGWTKQTIGMDFVLNPFFRV